MRVRKKEVPDADHVGQCGEGDVITCGDTAYLILTGRGCNRDGVSIYAADIVRGVVVMFGKGENGQWPACTRRPNAYAVLE